MPPPSLRPLVLLVPAVLLTLSPTVSTTKATMNTERPPSDFQEVKSTTSTSSTTAVLRTQTARALAADPLAPQDNVAQAPASPPTQRLSTPVNTNSTVKRKRPPRIRLIKVYKKVWRSPKRKNSSLLPSSGNATEASNRTLSRKQPASITVIELPLKPLPDEEKIESIMQLQQSSLSFNNSSDDDESSKEIENKRNGKQNTLSEPPDNGEGIKEIGIFGNESFEKTQPPSGVEKGKAGMYSFEIQGYSDKKSGKSMSSVSDVKNSKLNPSYPSDSDKKEDLDDEYTEVSGENKNNLQRNKNTSAGVVERFLDIQSEEIQDFNQNLTQTKIPGLNKRNESKEHTINKYNGRSDETTANQDLNCTTDTNPSNTLLPITSCQYGSSANESEKNIQDPINLHDDEPLNERRHETSTGVSEKESTLKNSSTSIATNGLNNDEETDIENEESTLASNQFNGKEHAELINESGITTELSSKEIMEVLERSKITIPVEDAPSTEEHKDSMYGANYLSEKGEIHPGGVTEKFDEVNSTAKSSIPDRSSANFEDSPQVNGSIPTNIPNLQDNPGDSRSTVDNLTANLSESTTSISIRENTESVLKARMPGNSSDSDIPTEPSSKSSVEEVIERSQFTFPLEDVPTKQQHQVTASNGNDPDKVEINSSVPEIIMSLDDVNSTTEPVIIHSSGNLEDITREYTIPTEMFNLPNNLSDIFSIDIRSNISKFSTIIPSTERTESSFTGRNTEESFDFDSTTELVSQVMVEEVMESDQLYAPTDNVSSKEQHQDSINNTNGNPETGKFHRIFAENSQKHSGDIPEIFHDGKMNTGTLDSTTTTETGKMDSLEYFEGMPRGHDSVPRNVQNLQDSTSNTHSTYLDTNRPNPSTSSATVENTLRPSYDPEITTELSSKGIEGKELENSHFLTIADSENNRERNETSENERAYFEDTFTSESSTLPQPDKDTKEYEPIIVNDTIRKDPLISSSSINEFSSLPYPESSTSLEIGEHELENKTNTYLNTDFSSEEDETKELFTISDVNTRMNEHGNNEEKINTEYHLDNSSRETDSPNVLRLLKDMQNVQDKYKETLSQLKPLANTHFTIDNSGARNSESSATSSMEINPAENRKLIYLENVTNNKHVSFEDVIEFTEMPHVSVSSETSIKPIKEEDTTPEIPRYSNSETTSDFNSTVFAKIFKNIEYPSLSRELNGNEEDKDEPSSRAPSRNVSNDFPENSVKFFPEGSTESVIVSDVSQEHTEQSTQTENLAHPNDFPLISEIDSENRNESLDRVENKNYSGRDMTTQVTEEMLGQLLSENNPESRTTVKYSELTQVPTPVADEYVNSEVIQDTVSPDLLKITHKSIYLNEERTGSFPQKETNIYNTPTSPQTRKHNYEPNNLNNRLTVSAIKTKSIPTMNVDMCQPPPNTSNAPKIKHSRIHTSQKDSSKMKIFVRDELRRILSKAVPIDKSFYQNIFQGSSLVNGLTPNKQVTQQNNEEPLLKHIQKKDPERTNFSTGKDETYSLHNKPYINSNSRPPISPITLTPATSQKQLPMRTYSSRYPVCFCPLKGHLVANDEPKTNSQVASFYNRCIQSRDQESGTGKLHIRRSQSSKSLIKQRPSSATPYSEPPPETSYSVLSPDFMEDGVPDSTYEALIKEVENRPRTFDILDYDFDNNDPITPQEKHTLDMSGAFHPRRVAFMTPAHRNGGRGLPKGARIFLGQSLVRSDSSLPIQQATKTDLFSTCYHISASIFDPLPYSPVPPLIPASFPILFPTPLLDPVLAFTPAHFTPLFIANSIIRMSSPGYSIPNSIPADSPSLMPVSLSKFGAFPAPFPASLLNSILDPPAASIPASDPAPACNPGLVPSLPIPILNTIPATIPIPMLDSILARTILNPILDTSILDPNLAYFPAPNLDAIVADIFAAPSVSTSDPFMTILSSNPTSITSYLSQGTPRTSCEDQKIWFWLEKLLLFDPELEPVIAPAFFDALDPASAPTRVSAPEPAPYDMASLEENRRGLWTGGDPWYFTFKDESSTKPTQIFPSESTSISSSSWMSPPPLSLPPLPLSSPPLSPPSTASPPPSPPLFRLLPLLTFPSLPPSQPLSPLPQFTPSTLPLLTSQPSPLPPPPALPFQTPQKRLPTPPPSSQSRTPPLPLLSIPRQTPPPPASLIKLRACAPILPPPPLTLQTKTPALPPAPLLPKLESPASSSLPFALTTPQLSRTPPLPLGVFPSIPLQPPRPPLPPSPLKLPSCAPTLPLTLQTWEPTLPPATLLPEFESSGLSSIPSAPSAPQPSTLPPSSWLPLPLLLLYSSRSPHLQMPLPFPPQVSQPSDQTADTNPCMRSLQKWHARISSRFPEPDRSTQER